MTMASGVRSCALRRPGQDALICGDRRLDLSRNSSIASTGSRRSRPRLRPASRRPCRHRRRQLPRIHRDRRWPRRGRRRRRQHPTRVKHRPRSATSSRIAARGSPSSHRRPSRWCAPPIARRWNVSSSSARHMKRYLTKRGQAVIYRASMNGRRSPYPTHPAQPESRAA